nr:hypothetical protein [Tanacetum cinerariifolium]
QTLDGTGLSHIRGPNFLDSSVDVEVVHKEEETLNEPNPLGEGSGSGLGRQETIGGAMAQIRFEGAPIQSSDLPLSTEKFKTAQAKEIGSLKKRIIMLEQKQSSRILSFHPFRAGTSRRHSLGRRKVSKLGSKNLKSQQKFQDIDDLVDEEVIVEDKGSGEKGGSTAKTMKIQKAKENRVAFKDVDDSARPIRSITTLQPLLTIDPKDKGKGILQEPKPVKKTKKRDHDQIERDVEVALRFKHN